MSLLFHVVFALFHVSLLTDIVLSAPATYDQRQTGDFNVRIDLKDLKILAFVDSKIVEDYTDYDYFYDYADFTIKPTSSTSSTTSSSVEPWSTWPTNPATTTTSTTNAIDSEGNASPMNVSTTTLSSTSRSDISTESLNKSTIDDQAESTLSSSGEGIATTAKSPSSRGTTKWRSNKRSKLETSSG